MDNNSNLQKPGTRKTPSREFCEKTIRRILMTETLEHGCNTHFKTAADFMNYFESLYPASDALTKQVQRAIKALDMPKDEKGYYIVNKTSSQMDEDNEMRRLLQIGNSNCHDLSKSEQVFLSVPPQQQDYLIHLLSQSITFQNKIITISKTYNGLILYTDQSRNLLMLLNSLTI